MIGSNLKVSVILPALFFVSETYYPLPNVVSNSQIVPRENTKSSFYHVLSSSVTIAYHISSSPYYSEDIHTKITLGITQRSHDPGII
jgi:hypothetical protein